MNILNEFYLAVMNRLIAEVPELEYFDWWNDQTDDSGDDFEFNLPAVFMEFLPVSWQTQGRKRQVADVSFMLHIGIENELERSSTDEERDLMDSLNKEDILDTINKALLGWNGNASFGSITSTEQIPDHGHDAVYVHRLGFKTRLAYNASQPETKKLTGVSFNFTGEFYKKEETA